MATQALQKITDTIIKRSQETRGAYLKRLQNTKLRGKIERSQLGCTNLAHSFASMPDHIKNSINNQDAPNFAIVSAYNDMLSAHQPFKTYPDIIKKELFAYGALAQFAGGTPAMCDGITQGYAGMELSLFSRDVIAMSSALALSHLVFDGAFYLGVCDKIVPGLLIGALSFGHLPSLFIPSGPMTSGILNSDKAKVRQLFAEGKVSRDALLESEMASYHSPGTCTFYGTANSNQMMVEMLGLHLPNSAFINPHTPLREALIKAAAKHMATTNVPSISDIITEKSIVNAIVGLMATGGSTNHTIHLIAIAKAAGIIINWDDFDALSNITPLLARVYPNGKADVNHFQAAGGLAFIIKELLDAELLHDDVQTVMGYGLHHYTKEPFLIDGVLQYKDACTTSKDLNTVRPVSDPFSSDGGLKVMKGNIGRSVIKVSAIASEHRYIEARAIIFTSQQALLEAFEKGELEKDFIAVLPFQGPRACGMPELHKLTPPLSVLQDKGFKVALITDGRMSGASGKVPAAIHMSPEALLGGDIAKIRTGDLIRFDANKGELNVIVDEQEWINRAALTPEHSSSYGVGRELFAGFRSLASSAETGATCFGDPA